MQGIYNQYDSDYDYYISTRNSRMHYDVENKQHIFITEIYGENGWEEYYIYTTFEVVYKVKHGSYSSSAESPDDYYDTIEVVAWDVISVVDEFNEEVNPKNFLTEEEYKRYTTSLDEFVGNF